MTTRTEELQVKLATAIKTRDNAIARVATLEAELAVEARLSTLQPGSGIVARLGRAGSNGEEGTLRNVDAIVLAIQDTPVGVRYKVQYGVGFDTDVVVIQTSQIVEIK